ncbi:MAG: transcriptional regulator [Microlunatus sp.]|nr:transcriptional regulator [Microlunatus sp.]
MTNAAEVLVELRAAGKPLPIVDLADRLGVHPNTIRFHLADLIDRGQVERVGPRRGSPGRPAHRFRAAPRMDRQGPRRYRLLAEILVNDLASAPDGAARSVAAGRAWGATVADTSGADTSGADTSEAGTSEAGTTEADAMVSRRDPWGEDPTPKLMAAMDDLGFAPERGADAATIILRHCPFLELAETGPSVVCAVHLGLVQGMLDSWRAPETVDRLEAFAEPNGCLLQLTAGNRHDDLPGAPRAATVTDSDVASHWDGPGRLNR